MKHRGGSAAAPDRYHQGSDEAARRLAASTAGSGSAPVALASRSPAELVHLVEIAHAERDALRAQVVALVTEREAAVITSAQRVVTALEQEWLQLNSFDLDTARGRGTPAIEALRALAPVATTIAERLRRVCVTLARRGAQ